MLQRKKVDYGVLFIDQCIVKGDKKKMEIMAMVWIDYKKDSDIVPQTWILYSLKMYKISENSYTLLWKPGETGKDN